MYILHANPLPVGKKRSALLIKWLLYYCRYLFCGLELYGDKVGELQIQTWIVTSFQYNILCILTLHNSKTTGHVWTFYISNNFSNIMVISIFVISIFVVELDARYDWWVTCTTPNMHRSLFQTSHLCVLAHITWELQVIYGHSAWHRTALLWEILLVWFMLLVRSDWRAMCTCTHNLRSTGHI